MPCYVGGRPPAAPQHPKGACRAWLCLCCVLSKKLKWGFDSMKKNQLRNNWSLKLENLTNIADKLSEPL
jgi:hypothetical protein